MTMSKFATLLMATALAGVAQPQAAVEIGWNLTQGEVRYTRSANGLLFESNGSETKALSGPESGASILEIEVDPFDRSNLYAVSSSGKLHRSSNGGSSWSEASSLAGFHVNDDKHIERLAVFPQNTDLLFWGGDGVYMSVNRGRSWSRVAEFGRSEVDRLVLTLDDQLVVFTQDGQVLRAAVPAKPEEAAAWTLRRDEIYIPKGQRGYALEGGDVAIAEEESNGEARAQWGRLANWESLPVASFARAEYSTRNAVTEGCRFEPIDPRTGRPDSYLDMSWRGGTFARVMRLDDRSNSNCVFRPYYCPTGVAVKDYRGQPLHQGSKNTTVLIDVPANRSGDVLPRALVLNNAPSRAADKTIVGIVRGALTSGNSCEWTVNSRNPEAPTSTQTTFEFWVSNHNPSCQSSFQANMIACTGAVRYHSYTFKSGLGECKQTSDPPACY